jgi:hypothetical protein
MEDCIAVLECPFLPPSGLQKIAGVMQRVADRRTVTRNERKKIGIGPFLAIGTGAAGTRMSVRFDMPRFDMPRFDMPRFDMPRFDMPRGLRERVL